MQLAREAKPNGAGPAPAQEKPDPFADVALFLQTDEPPAASSRRRFTDEPGLNVVKAFTEPEDALTMGRASKVENYWGAVIHAKGQHSGCAFLTQLVETRMRMSRSDDAWGSIQAADVARTTPKSEPSRRGFLGLFKGRREG